jgi:pSer/pThr/pTyr-binding forkhead associated (FHA) protein
MTSRLIIMTGKHQGKKMALVEGSKLVVGRDEGVAVRLATSEVSRRHCAIRVRAGVTTVEDLGSRNGTQINDFTIVEKTVLKHGDILRVGPMLFQYEVKVRASATGSKDSASIESETDEVIVKESTEDSIVNWLAEEEPAASDTDTVVGRSVPTEGHSAADSGMTTDDDDDDESSSAGADASAVPAPSKKQFDSVAEEAQDIIRRHLELKAR